MRDLVRDSYADFGPTLAAEKLREAHGLTVAKETVRRLMMAAGLPRCCSLRWHRTVIRIAGVATRTTASGPRAACSGCCRERTR
ncbi:protein of unknown function [Cupriavidus neocaledonicus]|uniref:HTH-like domain-containing protein n=1 Tax=Cupriavidus neocaledonicus TaxID=1040979 RepID=A0A375H511_9BURK|nr:hypothetical protein CBM2605_A140091 [Cupriavidus neocaledonicus]SPD46772.1 protein of unknown function [Cupriavidus neocaledonicus]